MRTWRDLAGGLNEHQREYLAGHEATHTPDELLVMAWEYAAANLTADVLFYTVPTPAHATEVHAWAKANDGTWTRDWTGPSWAVGPATVIVEGQQAQDGTCTAEVVVLCHDGSPLTAEQAHQLADALIEAGYIATTTT